MPVKVTVTLPIELLARMDRVAKDRSAFIEKAARAYLASVERACRDARDLAIIDANADRLNAGVADVLKYQRSLEGHS